MLIQGVKNIVSELFTLILCFVLAIIVWVVAVQASDPLTTKSLELEIQPSGLLPAAGEVTFFDRTVRIYIEGPQSMVQNLTADDFTAAIDLSQVSFGEVTVPIHIRHELAQVKIVLQEPLQTLVTAEAIIDKEIPVRVRVRGEPARGHQLGNSTSSPTSILVSGPASKVNALSEAQVTIFLDAPREDVITVRRPVFVDRNGAAVSTTGLKLSTEETVVTVVVDELAGVAEKPIIVNWSGQPAVGYRLLNVTIEPASVLVSGSPTILENLRSISTEPLDITGLNSSFEQRVTLAVPEGVVQEEIQPVLVTFEIEPILTTTVIRKMPELRALGEGLEAQMAPDQLSVFLFGPLPVLDSITEADVIVAVDLLDLKPGTYSLKPVVTVVASGVEVRSFLPEFITVTITPIPTVEPREIETETRARP